MLTPNFSDALLVFLYGVMGTLFVQRVVGMFKLRERVERLERVVCEASSRLIDCEEDMYALAEARRYTEEVQRIAKEKERLPGYMQNRRNGVRGRGAPGERRSERY